jgi:hypothetical protein
MQLREFMMPDIFRHTFEALGGSPGSSTVNHSRIETHSSGLCPDEAGSPAGRRAALVSCHSGDIARTITIVVIDRSC